MRLDEPQAEAVARLKVVVAYLHARPGRNFTVAELADAIEQHMPDGWYTRGQKAWRNAVRTTLAAESKAGRVLKRAGRGSQVYNLKGGAR